MSGFAEKIKGKLRYCYNYMKSAGAKKAFKSGKSSTYRFEDEIFCSSKEKYDEIKKQCNESAEKYWQEQQDFDLAEYFGERHRKRREMILDQFMPLFSEKPALLDVGCAGGAWTAMVAPQCSIIDGIEYSGSMVEAANKKWKDIENLSIHVGDARTFSRGRPYDGAMLLGLLMYMETEEDLLKSTQNIARHVRPGGYVLDNATLNCEGKKVIYLFNKANGYNAVYWSKETYYEQYEKAGFSLIKEVTFDDVETRRMHFIGQGSIWKRNG